MNKKINKILIANRGEIAARVIKTCKELGILTVAIYSEIDRTSLHVKLADESHCVGPAPAIESYLNQDKIVKIAKITHADAIHPGYGFLSENPHFAEKVNQNNIIFIGPTPSAIRIMGDKTAARSLAASIGLPIVPGTKTPLKSIEEAKQIADEIRYPILLKAAGGGGGKGMRVVRSESELTSSFRASQSEAKSAFNDERIYIEKYIENPRHIEVQIIADSFGNVVHLGERECSIQRRHQKIIEESPSVFINENTRAKLTGAAVKLIKHSEYTNAGTVEFIFDSEGNFYFLEMNTRLQVEHPVTEMRIGLDLVREQINVSEGKRLSFTQNEISFNGHAIECRIYAEDPLNNFFPSTGKIQSLKSPQGFGLREDRGVEEGFEITSYYDPLISKLIAFGKDRKEALNRMITALENYQLFGLRNNISLCLWVINQGNFMDGKFDTNFISKNFKPEFIAKYPTEILNAGIVAAFLLQESVMTSSEIAPDIKPQSLWKNRLIDNFR